MSKITIGFYDVHIYARGHPNDTARWVNLSNINGKTILDLFQDYLASFQIYTAGTNAIKPIPEDPHEPLKAICLEQGFTVETDKICGLFKAGEGGYAAEIYDSGTGSHSYTKTLLDVEIIPFYFQLNAPKNSKVAILGLQRFGVHGIATDICRGFENFVKYKISRDFIVTVSPIYVGGLYLGEYLEKGKIKSVEVVQYTKTKDISGQTAIVKKETISLSAQSRKDSLGKALNKILAPLKSTGTSVQSLNDVKVGISSYFSLGLTADQISKLNVTVEHNGNSRKVDANDIASCATHYDITGQVAKDAASGFPIYANLHAVCSDLINGDIRSLVRG